MERVPPIGAAVAVYLLPGMRSAIREAVRFENIANQIAATAGIDPAEARAEILRRHRRMAIPLNEIGDELLREAATGAWPEGQA